VYGIPSVADASSGDGCITARVECLDDCPLTLQLA
jgi:hypothetical protein